MAAGGGPPAYKMQQQHATNNAYGQPPQQQRQSRSSKIDEMLKKIPKVLRDEYIVEHEKPLGKGSFGAIFVASHSSGTKYAVKFENIPSEGNKPVLFYDQQFLGFLSVQHGCRYIPRFIDYGTTDFYHFLIMELCGPSIMDLFKASPKSYLSIPTVTILGMGMLTALHAVHELKIIHRDIKPDNFVLGTSSDPTKILMIDFGLSKQYISMGKHIKIRGNKDLTGTARYVSINTHAGLEQSRRDDLEALSYVLTYLFKGGRLPWIGIQVTDRHLHFKKICEIKESIDLNTLCEGCPEEMVPFISYCRGLPFQLDPNYQYLCELLLQISFRLNFSLDEKKYDWDMDPIFQRKIYSELERINYFGRNHSHQSGFNGNPYLH